MSAQNQEVYMDMCTGMRAPGARMTWHQIDRPYIGLLRAQNSFAPLPVAAPLTERMLRALFRDEVSQNRFARQMQHIKQKKHALGDCS